MSAALEAKRTVELASVAEEPSVAGRRCLVLGAGGFLGGQLASALCDRRATVEGYCRSLPPSADARVRWTVAAFDDDRALAKALHDQELVFLLGPSSGDLAAPDAAQRFAEHVAWTARLLDAARVAGVRTIVFASSGGAVYGAGAMLPTPESSPAQPISFYGLNRVAIECHLELYRRLYGLDYRVLRIANCYGPGQSPLRARGFVAVALQRAMSGRPIEIWGSSAIARDFIYVDDVVRALVHVAGFDGQQRIFNVGSGVARTLGEVIGDIARVLGMSDVAVIAMPPRLVDVPVSVLDTTRIRALTRWRERVCWEDGLAHTAEWLRAAYPP